MFMRINGQNFRSIWINDEGVLSVINQLSLPHAFQIDTLLNVDDVCYAISNMIVRGAGLIGATASYGIWIAARQAPTSSLEAFDTYIKDQAARLRATRPTANNLAWAIERQLRQLEIGTTIGEKIALAKSGAETIANEDAEFCRRIGQHGLGIIENLWVAKPGKTINILTHCNAGWLAL